MISIIIIHRPRDIQKPNSNIRWNLSIFRFVHLLDKLLNLSYTIKHFGDLQRRPISPASRQNERSSPQRGIRKGIWTRFRVTSYKSRSKIFPPNKKRSTRPQARPAKGQIQGGEKVRTAEEVRMYEYEPPSEPTQFMTDYFVNRHETVQVRRYEYGPPCPPPIYKRKPARMRPPKASLILARFRS